MSSRRWRRGGMAKRIAVRRKARSGSSSPWPAIWRSGVCEEASNDGAAGRTILKRLEDAEQQALPGRRKQVDAIEIGEAGEGSGIGVGGQPLARIAALEIARQQSGERLNKIARKSVLAAAVLAFDGGDLQMRRRHVGLHEQLAPRRADADDLNSGGRRHRPVNEREATRPAEDRMDRLRA